MWQSSMQNNHTTNRTAKAHTHTHTHTHIHTHIPVNELYGEETDQIRVLIFNLPISNSPHFRCNCYYVTTYDPIY